MSLSFAVALFVVSVLVILLTGARFTRLAETIAHRSGLGQALVGGVLLGAVTSLPGLITTGWAASEGRASFAVSNAMGGIAAQTTFVVVADLLHRRGNLEHASASLSNVMQSMVLIGLLSLTLLAGFAPEYTLGPVHPVTPLIVLAYLFGLRLAKQAHENPMWWPKEAREEETEQARVEASTRSVAVQFALLGVLVAASGYALAQSGMRIADETGLSDSFVGGVMTSVATSLPELVTTVFAVRSGALVLGVANIIGGNTFDVLMVTLADVLYDGSVYHHLDEPTRFVAAETILLTAVLAAGLLRRERRGIGFEGVGILAIYAAGIMILAGH